MLVGNLDYGDLRIKDGSAAAAGYQRLVDQPETPTHEKEMTLSDLCAYCERDTLAMVHLRHALSLPPRR